MTTVAPTDTSTTGVRGEPAGRDVLDHATEHGIGVIPWSPIAAGDLAARLSLSDEDLSDEDMTRLDAPA